MVPNDSAAPTEHQIHLTVLFGGQSAEHDISCVTAAHVLRALNPDRYSVTAIGIDRDGSWHIATTPALAAGSEQQLTARLVANGPVTSMEMITNTSRHLDPTPTTVVLPLLHGPLGEDGTVQGMLELMNLPYVGSGVLGSALCMDKSVAKDVLRANNIAQAKYQVGRADLISERWCDMVIESLGLPIFVKPANMGSSIGVTKVKTRDELMPAVNFALQYDEWIVAEEAITGREIEVAVLGDLQPETSIPGEIIPSREFYDYEDKYVDDGATLLIPADLSEEESSVVRQLAVRAFLALRAEGMARVDFFYEENGRGFLCNEINTIPGFTPISMYPKLWQATGIGYSDLIDQLVDLAIARHARKRRNTLR